MAFFSKKTTTAGVQDPFLDALVSLSSDSPNYYISASVLRNSDIYTAVNIIASDIASNRIESDVPLYETLINDKPNSYMTGYAFKYALAVNMLLNGNSFAEIDGHTLKLLPNNKMTVEQDDYSNKLRYYYSYNGKTKREIAPDNILHFKYMTQDGVSGISPLYSLEDERKIQKAGNDLLTGFFSQGVHGTTVVKMKQADLSQKAKDNIRDNFDEATTGSNALHTVVTDDSMDISNLQVNTDILKLVNSNDWTTKQIAKVFGLPVEKLAVENVHSNQTQSNVGYLRDTLQHYFDCFTTELNFKLGHSFKFNTDNLLTLDPEKQQQLANNGYSTGIYTLNEARNKAGLKPVAGGDTFKQSNEEEKDDTGNTNGRRDQSSQTQEER